MTNDQVAQIVDRIRMLDLDFTDVPALVRRRIWGARDRLNDLVDRIQTERGLDQIGRTELEVIATTALFSPAPGESPPAEICNELIDLARKYLGLGNEEARRPSDIVIAYGCGWQRETLGNGWFGRWDNAVATLSNIVLRFVVEANHALSAMVLGFPKSSDRFETCSPELQLYLCSEADSIALCLANPGRRLYGSAEKQLQIAKPFEQDEVYLTVRPAEEDEFEIETYIAPGSNTVLSFGNETDAQVKIFSLNGSEATRLESEASMAITADLVIKGLDDEAWILQGKSRQLTLQNEQMAAVTCGAVTEIEWRACGCAWDRCSVAHRLATWNCRHPLSSFVASAVKGPHRQIRVGAFQQGMYFDLLSRYGGFERPAA